MTLSLPTAVGRSEPGFHSAKFEMPGEERLRHVAGALRLQSAEADFERAVREQGVGHEITAGAELAESSELPP